MSKNWRAQKEPLQQISGNAIAEQPAKHKTPSPDEELPTQLDQKLTLDEQHARPQDQEEPHEGKAGKARRFKVQGETQTGSYTGFPRIRLHGLTCFHSQNEVRLPDELESPAEEHEGADDDYAYSRGNG